MWGSQIHRKGRVSITEKSCYMGLRSECLMIRYKTLVVILSSWLIGGNCSPRLIAAPSERKAGIICVKGTENFQVRPHPRNEERKSETVLWALLSRDCGKEHQGNKSNEFFSDDIKRHESIAYWDALDNESHIDQLANWLLFIEIPCWVCNFRCFTENNLG